MTIVKKPIDPSCFGVRAPESEIDCVMIHFCSFVDHDVAKAYDLDAIIGHFKACGVSSHYMIDRDGLIIQLVEEEKRAFHAGKGCWPALGGRENCMNDYSIGIELMAIGTKEEMARYIDGAAYDGLPKEWIGYTDAQYKALSELLEGVISRHPAIQKDRVHIIGHDEYAPGRKVDPGCLFDWSRIGF